LGLAKQSGVLTTGQVFDTLKSAPTTGYVDSVAVTIDLGSVFVIRSRPFIVGSARRPACAASCVVSCMAVVVAAPRPRRCSTVGWLVDVRIVLAMTSSFGGWAG